MNRDLPESSRFADPLIEVLRMSIPSFGPEKIERLLDEIARVTQVDDGRWATSATLSRTEWDIVVASLGALLARTRDAA